MPDVISNYAGNLALEAILPVGTTFWLAIHLSDPTVTGLLASELAGGSYVRQPIHFGAASAKTKVSTDGQTFTGLVASLAEYLAVWTAVSSGDMIFAKDLSPGIPILDSGQFLAMPGDVAHSL